MTSIGYDFVTGSSTVDEISTSVGHEGKGYPVDDRWP
jgi:hypothetical protein